MGTGREEPSGGPRSDPHPSSREPRRDEFDHQGTGDPANPPIPRRSETGDFEEPALRLGGGLTAGSIDAGRRQMVAFDTDDCAYGVTTKCAHGFWVTMYEHSAPIGSET